LNSPDSPGAARRSRITGILLVMLSTLVFGFCNALAKYLTRDYPIGEALAVRAGCALLVLLPFVRASGVVAALRANPKMHLLRMALSAVEIAAPLLAALFLTEIVLGLLGRAAPHWRPPLLLASHPHHCRRVRPRRRSLPRLPQPRLLSCCTWPPY
jgi:type III secretory pathway component EscT